MQKLHVIAVSKVINQTRLEVYVYNDGGIYQYFLNTLLENRFEYSNKIKDISSLIDSNMFEWTDFWINHGDVITRTAKDIFVNGKKVLPFSKLTKDEYSIIGPVTAKIYNEYIKSIEKDSDTKKILKESFDEGIFTTRIADIIEESYKNSLEPKDLNNLDKQIIIRVKIEGYNFIINFMKNLINSNNDKKFEYCEIFMSRVFIIESQNYIKVTN